MCPRRLLFVLIILLSSGCMKVGPDFVRPEAATSPNWIEADNSRLSREPAEYRAWWRAFKDPVLDRLIDTAYRQNLTLMVAGVRVLEVRAQLGIAVGFLYPQSQRASGYLQYNRISQQSLLGPALTNPQYSQSEVTLSASWELDFWGRFRRGVEAADADLMVSVADYDAALVALTADVATAYIVVRTLGKRIEIARENVQIQTESLKIAEARLRFGTASERDTEQAKTLLLDTQAAIPALEAQLRQAKNALSVLLGLPPNELLEVLGAPSQGIPLAPAEVAVGIPADLLRRRPDIRSAEFKAAAQSARIGVAKGDLYPAFSLSGTFGFLSTNFATALTRGLFRGDSSEYSVGPAIGWNILNYGRLTGNVRVQDARFQQLLISYRNAVLKAQQEVEDALAIFLRAEEGARLFAASAQSARRSYDLAKTQYREGVTDFTTVLVAERALLTEQDSLASTMGNIASSLVATYRALGGGWEIREGNDLIPPEVKEAMAKRTNWGALLEPAQYLPPPSGNPSTIRSPDW